jgi:hypothetical protein
VFSAHSFAVSCSECCTETLLWIGLCTALIKLLSLQVVSPHSPPSVLQQMAVVEGQMTWLVYISGAIVGGYSWSDSGSAEGEEVIDAR